MLTIEHLSKTFPGTVALNNVSFSVEAGDIHALVGANGSGKSTLIKALAGVQPADVGGVIRVGGVGAQATVIHAHRTTAELAQRAGVMTVHQEPAIFPELTVAENLAHGVRFRGAHGGRIRWRSVRQHAARVIEEFGLDIGPDDLAGDLRPAMRSMVAIARVLASAESTHGVLVLDEPTALLPRHDVDLLHEHLRRQAQAGRAILYVSHRLDEVISLCDHATVLRDGHKIVTIAKAELNQARLSEAMFAETATATRPSRTHRMATGGPVLSVEGLAGGVIRDVSFTAAAGEVVGFIGLADAGVNDIIRMVAGDTARQHGTVTVDGRQCNYHSPAGARDGGIGFIVGDLSASVFADQSLADNLVMADLSRYRLGPALRGRAIRSAANDAIDGYGVVTRGPDALMSTLSGGNQQKVVFARWLGLQPKVLLLEDPTAGVDVAARRDIYALLDAALVNGLAVVVCSSDLEELAMICDRVLVVHDGQIAHEVTGGDFTSRQLSQLIYEGVP
jgi:ribose transport system ATP-binding protein